MKILTRWTLTLTAALAAVVLQPSVGRTQSVSTFLGGSGTSELAQTGWTTAGNWNTGTVPSGSSVWAQINSSTAPILRINYGSTAIATGGTMSVGAISFLPTIALATGSTYELRNSSTSTVGVQRYYGVDTTVDGQSRKYILINTSTVSDVGVSQSGGVGSVGQTFELMNSGAIHVGANTSLTLSPQIKDGSGSQSITKTGQGILSFSGVTYASTAAGTANYSITSTYSGGFVLNGGIVQWASSGTAGVSTPFGLGPVTLQSGTLRSTTTGGRLIYNNVVLDGSATLGSTASGFTGNITVSNTSGSRSTTIASNSVITTADGVTTDWQQAMSGTGGLTKAGSGILNLSGSTQRSTFSGGFVADGGIVQWTNSGTPGVSTPFGLGSLTLRSGTLRSTGTTSREINTSVVLDGAVTLGSTTAGQTGIITVTNSGSTTVASNSVVTIVDGGTTAWNQATSGAGAVTKAGSGILIFTGSGGSLTHSGSTVVQAGTLIMNANLASAGAVSVLNGATLFGSGTIAGPATVQSGGLLSPGSAAANSGVLTFGSSLGLSGQTLLEMTGTGRGSQYDAFTIAGGLTYGGSLQLQFSGTLPEGTYNLFGGFSSQSGSFSTISLTGGYSGSLTNSSGVWTGTFGSQSLTFSNATGALLIVPEPTTGLLTGLACAMAAATLSRRRRLDADRPS